MPCTLNIPEMLRTVLLLLLVLVPAVARRKTPWCASHQASPACWSRCSVPTIATSGSSDAAVVVPLPPRDVTLTFRFSKPDYRPVVMNVNASQLRGSDDYPTPIVLAPATTWIAAARTRSPRIPALAALLVFGLALGWRTFRRGRQAVQRLQRLDTLKADATTWDPFTGQVLDRWLLTDCLGRGGMAWVYRALP